MTKFLLIVLAALGVIWWWKRDRPAADRPSAPVAPTGTAAAPQDMVKCSHCELHLPRADALVGINGKPYCSEQHRRLGTGV